MTIGMIDFLARQDVPLDMIIKTYNTAKILQKDKECQNKNIQK